MDKTELVTLVSSKTGLNEQMATLAVDTVIGFLKQKLPAELSGQLDSLLSGQESSRMGAVKGLFGRKTARLYRQILLPCPSEKRRRGVVSSALGASFLGPGAFACA